MPQVNCPCAKSAPINIDFDPNENERNVPCPYCYTENWADRETPESDPIRGGKTVTLRKDGTAAIAQDHG